MLTRGVKVRLFATINNKIQTIMEKNIFFEPFIGKRYAEGINGKRILVLGASFYCDRVKCPFFASCTSVIMKDSSAFDTKCPEYQPAGMRLHLEPSYCVKDYTLDTYHRFVMSMSKHIGSNDDNVIWDHLAFTNYVQFFLPAKKGKFRRTLKSDLSERDMTAFTEVVQRLQPDIVIVWGCVINSCLKERSPYLADMKELQETEHYICHLNIPGVKKPIAIINPYHPSSHVWKKNVEKFDGYLSNLLNH